MTRAHRVVVGLLAALACGAISACGGGGPAHRHHIAPQPDLTAVRATLHRAFVALADGDGGAFCRLATGPVRRRLRRAAGGASCRRVVTLVTTRLNLAQKQALRSARFGKVTVIGGRATVPDAVVSSPRGSLAGFLGHGASPTVLTRNASGAWRISG